MHWVAQAAVALVALVEAASARAGLAVVEMVS